MKHIVIVSLSAGAGHVRAAQAVQKTAETFYKSSTKVTHIDLKDYVSLPIKKALVDSYDLIIKQAPEIWGFLYQKTNSTSASSKFTKLANILKKINTSKFIKTIQQLNPDHVLFTHFLPAEIYSGLKIEKNLPDFSILITDYGLHELWVIKKATHYFVATNKIASILKERLKNQKSINVTGIPVDPVFFKKTNVSLLKKQHQVKKNSKVVLSLSGGGGLTDLTIIVKSLFDYKKPLHIFAVAGKNKRLYKKLQQLAPPKHITLTILDWVDNIDQYINMADLVIGKCGGMTTTECLTAKTPLIAINPIPGQEEQNAQYIVENNLGAIAHTKEDILYYLQDNVIKINLKPKSAAKEILDKILE